VYFEVIDSDRCSAFFQDKVIAEILSTVVLADSANISKSEASRCFQAYLQKSPVNYLLSYRPERAKYFLQQSGETINEIAERCGFQTASYFGKLFRREMGMTASQYRNNK